MCVCAVLIFACLWERVYECTCLLVSWCACSCHSVCVRVFLSPVTADAGPVNPHDSNEEK